ncbi:MAG: hypothetical protein N2422_10770, partial [Rhodobacteraceae bacterium]|nr:hypothetical protein [Paracoccaceae bacterium]
MLIFTGAEAAPPSAPPNRVAVRGPAGAGPGEDLPPFDPAAGAGAGEPADTRPDGHGEAPAKALDLPLPASAPQAGPPAALPPAA